MKCPDHARELKDLRCPVCLGELMAESELETRVPGALALLSAAVGARTRPRTCPQCETAMNSLRIGKAEAFVERCPSCETFWVEKADLKTLDLFAKSAARQAAFASMSDAEKRELASGLAEATKVDTGPDVGVAQAALSVATGVPMLDRVHGDRTPFLSWAWAAVLVACYAAFDAKDLALVAGSDDVLAAFTSAFAHFGLWHLLGNLAFLIVFGTAAEKKLPRWAYVSSVLALGPITALCQSLDSAPGTLIGGASGVIAGTLGMCLFLQPRARVAFFVRRQAVAVPLWLYGIGWGLLQALLWSGGGAGVGWVAHLTGFVAGLAIGFLFRGKSET
ncbi:MAG: rhomboid family intramembrane serine protease [Archangiaceae bacterium]|nr:rhomboid family intramembrane serine protease [Archangiaceae bacterium]